MLTVELAWAAPSEIWNSVTLIVPPDWLSRARVLAATPVLSRAPSVRFPLFMFNVASALDETPRRELWKLAVLVRLTVELAWAAPSEIWNSVTLIVPLFQISD